MKKGFYPHLISVSVLHALLFTMGAWQVMKTDQAQVVIPKLGNGIIQMQVASGLFMPRVSAPEKKVVTVKPIIKTTAPTPKTTVSAPTQETAPAPTTASVQTGINGTGGTPDGHSFGSGTVGSGKYSAKDLYKAELRAMIDKNKSYPTMSRRLGQTGTVVIAFTLLEDGELVDVRIHQASPYERLNASALDAVRKVERFRPIPKEVGEKKLEMTLPVKFVTI